MIRAAIKHRMNKPEEKDEDYEQRKDTWTPLPKIKALLELTKLNIGFVFCKVPLTDVTGVIKNKRTPAAARAGLIAPKDVYIKAGPTGLDPN